MKKINSKKASHVGMMLSFVIFIGALIFLYSSLSPQISMEKRGKYAIDEVETKLFNSFKEDLLTILIKVPDTLPSSTECVEVDLSGTIPNELGDTFQVKDKDGNNLDYYVQGNLMEIEYNDEDFLKILTSGECIIGENSRGCIKSRGYDDELECESQHTREVGTDAVNKAKYFFRNKIIETGGLYVNDYYGLKEDLDIFPEIEFDFVFVNATGDKEWDFSEFIEEEENIYINQKDIAYVDDHSAELLNGSLILRVWNKG